MLEYWNILAMAFTVAFSGAVVPGPLFAYTLNESPRRTHPWRPGLVHLRQRGHIARPEGHVHRCVPRNGGCVRNRGRRLRGVVRLVRLRVPPGLPLVLTGQGSGLYLRHWKGGLS
jgi:hypothetical protein